MRPFHWLREYFDLNKREQRGFAVLMAIILAVIIGRQFIPGLFPSEQADMTHIKAKAKAFQERQAALVAQEKEERNYHPLEFERENSVVINASPFDPNTVSGSKLIKMGLPDRVVKNLVLYREKGGRFRKPEDLGRIYGMRPEYMEDLKPFIRIETKEDNLQSRYDNASAHPVRAKIELNAADSISLLKVRGIGPVFSSRIVRFRNLLGGFYKMEQLREVYGIDSLKYEKLLPQLELDTGTCHKMNINKVGLDELKAHPYIRWKLANAIIQYRVQHGNYRSVEDLKKIAIMNDELYQKLTPYLTVE